MIKIPSNFLIMHSNIIYCRKYIYDTLNNIWYLDSAPCYYLTKNVSREDGPFGNYGPFGIYVSDGLSDGLGVDLYIYRGKLLNCTTQQEFNKLKKLMAFL